MSTLGVAHRLAGKAFSTRKWPPQPLQLARYGDAGVVARAAKAFDDDDAGRHPLPGSLRSPVTRAAGMHADAARFERLLQRLRSAAGEEERRLHALALAGGRDPARARALLEVSLDGTLPPNIASALPGLVTDESPHARLAYDYTVSNWAALARLAGSYFDADGWLLPSAGWSFNERALARQVLEDQRRLSPERGAAAAQRAAARIELLADVKEREAQALGVALKRVDAAALSRPHPFTHTTCFSVCTTSTRSRCAAMTTSMSL